MKSLTQSQARRRALQAQGLHRARRDAPVTMRDVQRVIDRVAQFQIDSVNVAVRAHYMPLFSRLGDYDRALLDRAFGTAPRRLVEYWGHAASLIDVRLFHALQFKMQRDESPTWVADLHAKNPGLTDQVLQEVRDAGPITARQIQHDEERQRDSWGWNWSAAKIALEWHFSRGLITSARRNAQFERVYDLPERVLPSALRESVPLAEDEQRLVLARRAAQALGVFTERCLSQYFYTARRPTRLAIDRLVELGEIEPVSVQGWTDNAWHVVGEATPRHATGRALLSPFDSMMFDRDRIHALFDYFFRIEIYVPEAKRVHGYYVYTFLLGEELVARVDLKADRASGVLVVKSAWLEPDRQASPAVVTTELSDELRLMARWLRLEGVRVEPRGDLAEALSSALDAPAP